MSHAASVWHTLAPASYTGIIASVFDLAFVSRVKLCTVGTPVSDFRAANGGVLGTEFLAFEASFGFFLKFSGLKLAFLNNKSLF